MGDLDRRKGPQMGEMSLDPKLEGERTWGSWGGGGKKPGGDEGTKRKNSWCTDGQKLVRGNQAMGGVVRMGPSSKPKKAGKVSDFAQPGG